MGKRWCFYALFFSIISTVIAVKAQPRMLVQPTKIELGTIYQGEMKKVRIMVSNIGNQPLTISSVQTSCGCTSAKTSVPTLVPSAVDTIDVTFNSAGFDGKIFKTVTIQSNDPLKAVTDVTLLGTVVSELGTEPKVPILNFGAAQVGKKGSASFKIKNISSAPITLLGVSSSDSSIHGAVGLRTLNPSDTLTITVSFIPRSVSIVNNFFYIETNSPRQPRVPFRFMYIGN